VYCIVRSQYIHTRLHNVTFQKTVIFCHHHENPTHIAIHNLEKMLGHCAISAKTVGGGPSKITRAWKGTQDLTVLPMFFFCLCW